MSLRAPATAVVRASAAAVDAARARLLTAILLLAAFDAIVAEPEVCAGAADGLHADFSRACSEYVRCAAGAEVARYSCEPGRAFSGAAGACVPRALQPCVPRACAPADRTAYAAPATACRDYYRCENGTAGERACPPGAWFDSERGECTRAAGACYEPLCVGLADGLHADVSHDCRRRLECRGGELRAVAPCPGGAARCPPAPARCPPPRSAAVALPVGDADSCADDACDSPCELRADGAHADRASGCRRFYVCAARRVVDRGECGAGELFSGASASCEPAARVACERPARGVCFGRADGAHRDRRDCRSWFACRRERVVARGSCDERLVWDGGACVARERFRCEGPAPSLACASRPSGFYRDLESDCVEYYHCAGLERTDFACPAGLAFDGAACVRAAGAACPSRDRDSCYGKADGRYGARGGGCRGYYACAAGQKSVYACPAGLAFSAARQRCEPAPAGCPAAAAADAACAGRRDGYHRDESSGCRSYVYCERSERIATLTCSRSRLFDGEKCVDPEEYTCPGG